MAFHRLTVPTYFGGLPAGYDYINNALSGTPAPADGAKVGGTNAGTYFDAFQEDATSSNANRGNKALAQNCDLIDDWFNASVAAATEMAYSATGGETYIDITDDVFMGKFGTANTQDERNQLILLLDAATGNIATNTQGQAIRANVIGTLGGSSRVGLEATGFYTDPRVSFTSSLFAAASYRLLYLKRSSLKQIAETDIGSFTRYLLRSGDDRVLKYHRILTSSHTVDDGGFADATIFLNPAASFTLTLVNPAVQNAGRRIRLVDSSGDMSSAAKSVTVAHYGSTKINGSAADVVLSADYGQWELSSDGTDWYLA